MSTVATAPAESVLEAKLKRRRPAKWSIALFTFVFLGGIAFIVRHVSLDLSSVPQLPLFPYLLLALALLIALGFEFVNGFHDTANAVATVIYTHSMEPHLAVVWSGLWNFVGVLVSSGTVAFTIISLLPVELVLKTSQGAGFSMIFALLTAAVLWNLGTWMVGLPVSSSHTMIGSILGVGIANQLMNGRSGTSAVDWSQVTSVFKALVFSPIIGFVLAGGLYLGFKLVLRNPKLYTAPEGSEPPPWPIRALLIATCTGVSFAHGQNDGQKGMGLIMLILVGTVPTAYALNQAVDRGSVNKFAQISTQVAGTLGHYAEAGATPAADPANDIEKFVATHQLKPSTIPSLQQVVLLVRDEAINYGSLGSVPQNMKANVRNQMYLISETLRLLAKYGPKMGDEDTRSLETYKGFLDKSTKYIPSWVKVAVALALGLGTMVGWKRIVVTVGEKIGKAHLNYAQGASAELVAAVTILGASFFGMPVSTTHVLSSGVAGSMAASGAGLQKATMRNIALAWFFTLPAAALLSGGLFSLFQAVAR